MCASAAGMAEASSRRASLLEQIASVREAIETLKDDVAGEEVTEAGEDVGPEAEDDEEYEGEQETNAAEEENQENEHDVAWEEEEGENEMEVGEDEIEEADDGLGAADEGGESDGIQEADSSAERTKHNLGQSMRQPTPEKARTQDVSTERAHTSTSSSSKGPKGTNYFHEGIFGFRDMIPQDDRRSPGSPVSKGKQRDRANRADNVCRLDKDDFMDAESLGTWEPEKELGTTPSPANRSARPRHGRFPESPPRTDHHNEHRGKRHQNIRRGAPADPPYPVVSGKYTPTTTPLSSPRSYCSNTSLASRGAAAKGVKSDGVGNDSFAFYPRARKGVISSSRKGTLDTAAVSKPASSRSGTRHDTLARGTSDASTGTGSHSRHHGMDARPDASLSTVREPRSTSPRRFDVNFQNEIHRPHRDLRCREIREPCRPGPMDELQLNRRAVDSDDQACIAQGQSAPSLSPRSHAPIHDAYPQPLPRPHPYPISRPPTKVSCSMPPPQVPVLGAPVGQPGCTQVDAVQSSAALAFRCNTELHSSRGDTLHIDCASQQYVERPQTDVREVEVQQSQHARHLQQLQQQQAELQQRQLAKLQQFKGPSDNRDPPYALLVEGPTRRGLVAHDAGASRKPLSVSPRRSHSHRGGQSASRGARRSASGRWKEDPPYIPGKCEFHSLPRKCTKPSATCSASLEETACSGAIAQHPEAKRKLRFEDSCGAGTRTASPVRSEAAIMERPVELGISPLTIERARTPPRPHGRSASALWDSTSAVSVAARPASPGRRAQQLGQENRAALLTGRALAYPTSAGAMQMGTASLRAADRRQRGFEAARAVAAAKGDVAARDAKAVVVDDPPPRACGPSAGVGGDPPRAASVRALRPPAVKSGRTTPRAEVVVLAPCTSDDSAPGDAATAISRRQDAEYVGFRGANGKREGYGVMRSKDGSIYSGNWASGVREGKGTLFFDGGVFEGQWQQGSATGQGFVQFKNGETFVGNYVNGKKSGPGVYRWPDGAEESGEYAAGVKVGMHVWRHRHEEWQVLYDQNGQVVSAARSNESGSGGAGGAMGVGGANGSGSASESAGGSAAAVGPDGRKGRQASLQRQTRSATPPRRSRPQQPPLRVS